MHCVILLGVPGATESTVTVSSTFMSFFFFNDTATPEIYTLSLHDALPISTGINLWREWARLELGAGKETYELDRKSTRLNSSHEWISYAVFCLKKKKKSWQSR